MTIPFAEWLQPIEHSRYAPHKAGDPSDVRMAALLTSSPSLEDTTKQTVVLLGVPQDIGVQRNGGRPGAAAGPAAIRRYFYLLTPFLQHTSLDSSSLQIWDWGDLKTDGLSLEEIHARQEQIVAYLLERRWIPVVLGGGHDIAYPNGMALARWYERIGIVNFDAHLDVRPLIDNVAAHSGSPFRQLLDHPTVTIPPGCLVAFGVQWFSNARNHCKFLEDQRMTLWWWEDIRQVGVLDALKQAFQSAQRGTKAVYVTFDLDGVRASDAPGVSAPTPIGLSAEDYCLAAYYAGHLPTVKLIDIAELNPRFDHDDRTARLAARILAYFLAGLQQRSTRTSKES